MVECVALLADASRREHLAWDVENLGENWRCRTFDAQAPALTALRQGCEMLLTDSLPLLNALQEHPLPIPPWVLGVGISHPMMDAPMPPVGLLPAWLAERSMAIPSAAQSVLPQAQHLAHALLNALSLPEHAGARRFLPQMLGLMAVHPPLASSLQHRLYPLCARLAGMTPGAVERSLRLAVESTWSRGDLTALERFFGSSVDPDRGKPTNREFLFRLQERLMLALQRIYG